MKTKLNDIDERFIKAIKNLEKELYQYKFIIEVKVDKRKRLQFVIRQSTGERITTIDLSEHTVKYADFGIQNIPDDVRNNVGRMSKNFLNEWLRIRRKLIEEL